MVKLISRFMDFITAKGFIVFGLVMLILPFIGLLLLSMVLYGARVLFFGWP